MQPIFRAWPAVLALALLCSANTAAAMQAHLFDFRQGNRNADWHVLGPIKVEQVPDGLLLSVTAQTGAILTDQQVPWLAHAARLSGASPEGTEIELIWAYQDENGDNTYSVTLDVPAGDIGTSGVNLAGHDEWREGEKRIGLLLKPHTTVLVSTLEFGRWNAVEQAVEASAAFWQMDQYRPYSINFSWGPRWTTNPVARQYAYADIPPTATSYTFIIFCGLALLCAGLWLWSRPSGRRAAALSLAGIAFAACWLLLDLRMGMEFLTWVHHDHVSYIAREPSPDRRFRDRHAFYDFAAFAAPLVADRQSYLFFAEQQWPYLGNIRYLTYPAVPGNGFETDDTWVVYRRPDMTLDPEGRLTLAGRAITAPGVILGRFDESSFVFRSQMPSPAPQP